MQAIWIFILTGAILLLASPLMSGEVKGLTNPQALLAVAVAKLETCEYETRRYDIESNGEERELGLDNEETGVEKKISLRLLLKTGRFHLERGNDEMTKEGLRAIVIKFSPQDKVSQLAAEIGEDKHYNRAMNHMAGEIWLDPATGSIMRVKGGFVGRLVFRYLLIPVVKLYEIAFVVEQSPAGEIWRPESSRVAIKASRIVGGDIRRRYQTYYRCGPARPVTYQ